MLLISKMKIFGPCGVIISSISSTKLSPDCIAFILATQTRRVTTGNVFLEAVCLCASELINSEHDATRLSWLGRNRSVRNRMHANFFLLLADHDKYLPSLLHEDNRVIFFPQALQSEKK